MAEKQADYIASKWIAFMQNKESNPEFFYHDHSLAYRAINLIECMDFFFG